MPSGEAGRGALDASSFRQGVGAAAFPVGVIEETGPGGWRRRCLWLGQADLSRQHSINILSQIGLAC
jgi:hypothetical protein